MMILKRNVSDIQRGEQIRTVYNGQRRFASDSKRALHDARGNTMLRQRARRQPSHAAAARASTTSSRLWFVLVHFFLFRVDRISERASREVRADERAAQVRSKYDYI